MIEITVKCHCGHKESWSFPDSALEERSYIEDGIREDLEFSGWVNYEGALLCRDCAREDEDEGNQLDFPVMKAQLSSTKALDRTQRSGG